MYTDYHTCIPTPMCIHYVHTYVHTVYSPVYSTLITAYIFPITTAEGDLLVANYSRNSQLTKNCIPNQIDNEVYFVV